ncbi:helix-turn-helix domain-containing protein [Halostagnicola sp. A-GB9-2]|uniref:helix-turn-helix domain-containing protein n=1 Tax=Halostagnicola sp. A-GB9-2 TaxID=3048066 RepID=UPI0024C0354E|nr:helix-turn-helix domain-containing protein [Halostagnicola sp. A-GB9-2]MDJ1432248.1 helix-turn-helix domain-containing protein [Halostagnicola sp. A-GB9-2]
MKRIRITLDPAGDYAPPLYGRLAGGAPYLEQARIVNWNVAAPPTAFLLWIRGDYQRFETELEASTNVDEYELLPITDRECHCFFEGAVADAARLLFENFTQGSLITVPPVECNDDGSNTFSIIGTGSDIQRAVEGVPNGVEVTVEAVGGKTVAPDSAVGRLSRRQRETVKTALEVGYYEVPRDATTEVLARELDCATATAAEHLQKAESKLIRALFDV